MHSPAESRAAAKLPGRTLFAPTPLTMVGCRGGVPDAPCNFALLQNLWFIVGADSISARAALRKHPTARRGQDPSLRTNHKCQPTSKTATPHNPPGRRGRRPLRTTKKPQQIIKTTNHPIVECWPRAGASPSALGFLRETARSAARATREPFPLSRASRAIGSSGTLFGSFWGSKRNI